MRNGNLSLGWHYQQKSLSATIRLLEFMTDLTNVRTIQVTDQQFKFYALHEWCDLNRLSNAYFDAKF
jgi:hypothetical protein